MTAKILTALPVLTFLSMFAVNPSFYLEYARTPAFVIGFQLAHRIVPDRHAVDQQTGGSPVSEMIDTLAISWPLRTAALIVVFLIVCGAVVLISNIVVQRGSVRQRIAKLATGDGARVADSTPSDLLAQEKNKAWTALADAVEKAGISLADTKADHLRRLMLLAGYRSPAAPRIYTLARIILLAVFPAIFLLLTSSRPTPPSIVTLYLGSVICASVGLYFPRLWVQAKADRRKTQIVNGFPDCLDLRLLVCIEEAWTSKRHSTEWGVRSRDPSRWLPKCFRRHLRVARGRQPGGFFACHGRSQPGGGNTLFLDAADTVGQIGIEH